MLDVNIKTVLRTTKKHLEKLKEMGIVTVRDLLLYFPRTYEDQSEIRQILAVQVDEKNTIMGRIEKVNSIHTRTGKTLILGVIADQSGTLPVIWFNQPYLKQLLPTNKEIILSGKVTVQNGIRTMQSPQWERAGEKQIHAGIIVPVYPESALITSKWLRTKIHTLLPHAASFKETLNTDILTMEKLMSRAEAIKNIHFPESREVLEKAKERLALEEVIQLHTTLLKKKEEYRSGGQKFTKSIQQNPEMIKKFVQKLPFSLTNAQTRTITEIRDDLAKNQPMVRLVQGDVGSGKTVVAAAAMYRVIQAGYQTLLLAPTDVLVQQHAKTLETVLGAHDIKTAVLRGSTPKKEKETIKEGLKQGTIMCIIGTHAVLQEDVIFKNLGLAIIDEQHKFGVVQRNVLKKHGEPHLLHLTATPIPRTLAIILFGEQDLSVIDEMPPGRKQIMTRVVPESKRPAAYQWMREQILAGRQVFVICALIDESDVLEIKSAEQEYEKLKNNVFNEFSVGLLHGKLSADKKNAVMEQFAAGKIHVLVSTSVIEVGIDVPNATIMMIEDADRFGLSQLHQFRGRVGRGEYQSYCLLFTKSDTENSRQRLAAMVQYASGFLLAEIDLKLRGPGELFGVRQSGLPDLRMASLADSRLIARGRMIAEKIYAS